MWAEQENAPSTQEKQDNLREEVSQEWGRKQHLGRAQHALSQVSIWAPAGDARTTVVQEAAQGGAPPPHPARGLAHNLGESPGTLNVYFTKANVCEAVADPLNTPFRSSCRHGEGWVEAALVGCHK